MAFSKKIVLTTQDSETRPQGARTAFSWSELCETLTTPEIGQKTGSGFSPAVFVDDYRAKKKMRSRSAIVFDVEMNEATGEVPPDVRVLAQQLKAKGIAAVIATTFSHTPDQPRYRVLIPLKHDLEATDDEDWPNIDAAMMWALAEDLKIRGVIDDSKIGPASLYFWPRCETEESLAQFQSEVIDGTLLDAGPLISRARSRIEAQTASAQSLSQRAAAKAPRLGTGALARAESALLPLEDILRACGYEQVGTRWIAPSSKSRIPGVLILKGDDGVDRVISHHATDPLNCEREVFGVKAHDVLDVALFYQFGADLDGMTYGRAVGKLISAPKADFVGRPVPDAATMQDARERVAAAMTSDQVVGDDGMAELFEGDVDYLIDELGEKIDLTPEEVLFVREKFGRLDSLHENEGEEVVRFVAAEIMKARRAADPAEPDLGPLPVIPGVVGDLMRYQEAICRKAVPLDSFVLSSLVAMAAATRHKFVVEWDQGPTALNLEAIVQVSTGQGKEAMRTLISKVAKAAGAPTTIDRAASMQGLHRHMEENTGLATMLMDEFGKTMVDVSQGKAPNEKVLLDFMTQLFGRSLDTVSPAPARRAKDSLGPIDKPFLCLLATAAKDLSDGLRMAHITGGTLNRRLIHADLTKYPRKPRGLSRPTEMDAMLKAALTVLYTGGTNLQSGAPDDVRIKGAQRDKVMVAGRQFTPVRFTEEAEDRLFEWIDIVGEKEIDERVGDVWSRTTELTVKVAGLIAIGDAVMCDVMMDAPTWRTVEITVKHTDVAIEILRRSMRALERIATMEIHDSDAHSVKMLILTKLGEDEAGMTKSELTRKTQNLSRRDRDEALFDLAVGGLIRVEKVRGKRPNSDKENPGPTTERYVRTWRELE